jgi:hypothetical protein
MWHYHSALHLSKEKHDPTINISHDNIQNEMKSNLTNPSSGVIFALANLSPFPIPSFFY